MLNDLLKQLDLGSPTSVTRSSLAGLVLGIGGRRRTVVAHDVIELTKVLDGTNVTLAPRRLAAAVGTLPLRDVGTVGTVRTIAIKTGLLLLRSATTPGGGRGLGGALLLGLALGVLAAAALTLAPSHTTIRATAA